MLCAILEEMREFSPRKPLDTVEREALSAGIEAASELQSDCDMMSRKIDELLAPQTDGLSFQLKL